MVFNVVKVLEIEPGAELDDTVYDQWVRIAYKDHSLSLFDMSMIAYESVVGEYHEVQIGVMFTELEEDAGPMMAKGNRFQGKVVAVTEEGGLFRHIVDLDGLKVILSDQNRYEIGAILKFKARLDLLDFRGATGGWKAVDTD
jgi:hypothetical protein